MSLDRARAGAIVSDGVMISIGCQAYRSCIIRPLPLPFQRGVSSTPEVSWCMAALRPYALQIPKAALCRNPGTCQLGFLPPPPAEIRRVSLSISAFRRATRRPRRL